MTRSCQVLDGELERETSGPTEGRPIAMRSLARAMAGALVVLVLASLGGSEAATKTAAKDRFLLSRWTVADGLPHSTVRVVARAADGYLWLGTDEGLARFDGLRFRAWTSDDGLPRSPCP